jgi:hypothetical protein
MSAPNASDRDAVARDAMYQTVGFTEKLMTASEEAEYMRRFREDALFRREVVLTLATDHMQTRFEPDEAPLLTRRERAREERAMWNEQYRVMVGFMKKRPTEEQMRLRELTWAYLMKKYGFPALDLVTWELV